MQVSNEKIHDIAAVEDLQIGELAIFKKILLQSKICRLTDTMEFATLDIHIREAFQTISVDNPRMKTE